MSRRSRADNASSISLFSFQDIMTAVMGILIFITLMMALDLTSSAAMTAQPAPSMEATSATDLSELRARVTALQKHFQRMQQHVRQLTEMERGQGLANSRGHLLQTYVRLRELQQQITSLSSKPLDATNSTLHDTEQQLARMRRQIADLKTAQARHGVDPRLAYIRQAGQLQPILVELSSEKIGVGPADLSQPAIWFTSSQAETRLNQLIAFVGTVDPHRQYFVILLKPSAFGGYADVRTTLHDKGFQTGLDLIPESKHVLPQ